MMQCAVAFRTRSWRSLSAQAALASAYLALYARQHGPPCLSLDTSFSRGVGFDKIAAAGFHCEHRPLEVHRW